MYEREIARERLELLPQDFYRQDSLVVAPILIGCVVETNKKGVVTSGRITETEAYPGYDAASHAYKNKHTPRTEVQYLEGGRLYIYQIMGLHLMTSIVVGDKRIADVDTGTRINLGIHDKDHEEARITMDRKWRFYNTNSLFISK